LLTGVNKLAEPEIKNIRYYCITLNYLKMGKQFSAQVKETISISREIALTLGKETIAPEHLALALITDSRNTASGVLKSFQVDLEVLRQQLEETGKDPLSTTLVHKNAVYLTAPAEQVVRNAVDEADAFESRKVETEHLLLAILKNKQNPTSQVLHLWNVDYDAVKHSSLLFNAQLKKNG
jgi:ATP-dependent Clp protease ATP-binding subunit ClpC